MAKVTVLIFSCILFISNAIASEAVDSWGEASRPANSGAPISIIFGNGIFVAGGLQGTILTSSDGVNWTRQNSGITTDITRVKFVNGRFFAFSSQTLTSPDGITWSVIPNLPEGVLLDITYANGTYFGVRPYRLAPPPGLRPLLTSTNLTDWVGVSDKGYYKLNDIAYANGTFVARANQVNYQNPGLEISHDGTTWTLVSALPPHPVIGGPDAELTYQNGTFFTFLVGGVTVVTGGFPLPGIPAVQLAFSLNGTNWDSAFNGIDFYSASSATAIPLKIATGGNYYVIPGTRSIYYSTNLVSAGAVPSTNWTQVTLPVASPETAYVDVAFGNEVFVAAIFGKIFKSNPVSGVAGIRIIQQPNSISANVGGTAMFSVLAQGSDPITYQWRKNTTNISGATAHSLTLTNIAMSDAGEYDVVITNPGGPLTSDKAVLSVHFADVNLYAGVTLRGNIGDKFLIEYQNQIDPSGEWHFGANVTLTTLQSIWFDAESGGQTNRFYRATFQGQ